MDFARVAQIIADYKEIDAGAIQETSLLLEDLELDSLDTVELIMNFEEELGISLEMDQSVKTVGDVVNLIKAAASNA